MPSVLPLEALRRHRWVRRAFWAVVALLALWLLSWLLVPVLAKGPLERKASELLGRPVTVGALEFTPWTLEVTLRDLVVGGLDGAAPQLEIARVYADAELQSLVRLAPVVDALAIDSPHLRLTLLADGHYDVDDILARFAAPPDTPNTPETGPARLALYNLTLTGGEIDFNDRTVSQSHTVRKLTLQVPFLSTLPSQREIKVEPHLSFDVADSHFSSSAQATPFDPTGKGEATIQWDGLDLAPYLAYLPASLPVRLQGAVLDLDLKLAFEQKPEVAVKLTGTAQARKVQIADRSQQALLSWDRLSVALDDVRPLDHVVRLGSIELDAPLLSAARDAAGVLNLAQLATPAPTPKPAPTSPAASAPSAPAASQAASGAKAQAPKAPAWSVSVAQIAVRQGTVHWADQSTRPAAALVAAGLSFEASAIAFPFQRPFPFHGALGLQGSTLAFEGQASDQTAQLKLSVKDLGLALAAPYLANTLEPELVGQINGDLGVQWDAAAAGKPGATGVTLDVGPLSVSQLALKQGKTSLASVSQIALEGAKVNLDGRTVGIERLAISQPQTRVERGADGRWMFERWLKDAPASASSTSAPPDTAARPWRVQIAQASVEGGKLGFADRSQPRPVALSVSALALQASKLALDGSQPEAFTVSARVGTGTGKGDAGKLSYKGTLTPQPFATQGQLDASRLPLQALDGYLADRLAIELLQGEAGFRGDLAFAQTGRGNTLSLSGDAAIDQLRANSTGAATAKTASQVGEELLAWKSLGLRGLNVKLVPDTAPRVEVKETSLADFYARLSIDETGRINLDQLVKTPGQGAIPPAADTVASATATSAQAAPAAPATPAVAQAGAPDPLAPVLQFGPMSLVNGKVLFSDYFIKPNYSADLSELTGKLSAFSSQTAGGEPVLADLELRGWAEGSASLEVSGKLNPLAKPLALDIQAKVRDLELPPLSPYAVKYAGHGIERGKLSMDVAYKVLPSGQLTASNKLVLNQLTFGDPVANAPNSLPVKLAVALLSDSHGVIDLDLPISGSLNDPQFKLGPVIFKIIVNLIGKAITAPFSLLASALGGGDELSSVAFAPGSAALTPQARQGLDKLAKALAARPALRMTVTGTASLAREREALQRERLAQLVQAEKRRASPQDKSPVQAAEYPALLKAAYGRADMPKPRNLVGMAKDLPVAEMEALLLAHLPAATEGLALELAAQRGQAVKTYLAAQKLPEARLFLAAPKAVTPDGNWTPQAQLSLAAQ
jgi:hypothetical protein